MRDERSARPHRLVRELRSPATWLTVGVFAWFVALLMGGERLPVVSWWLVVWVAATCSLLAYWLGRYEGERVEQQRVADEKRRDKRIAEDYVRAQQERAHELARHAREN